MSSKIHIVLFVFLSLTLSKVAAQSPFETELDSINNELQKAQEDTLKIKLWVKKGSILYASDSIAAENSFQKAIKLSEDIKWQETPVLYGQIANVYYGSGHFDKYKTYMNLSIRSAKELNEPYEQGRTHHYIGVSYHIEGNYDSARYHYNQMIKLAVKHNYPSLLGSGYNNRGNLAFYQSDLPLALDFYLKGLKVREFIKDSLGINGSTNNVGLIYGRLNDPENALKYHKKALDIAKGRNDESMQSIAYSNVADDYSGMGQFDKALENFHASRRIREKMGSDLEISRAYSGLGITFLEYAKSDQKHQTLSKDQLLDSGFYYLTAALPLAKKYDDKFEITTNLRALGDYYSLKGNNTEAAKYYEESGEVAKQIEAYYEIGKVSRKIADLKAEKGDFKSAYTWLNTYIEAKDSLYDEEQAREMTKKDMQYEFEKEEALKDQEHELELERKDELAKADRKRQLVIIGAVSLGFVLVVVFSFFLYKRFKITQRQKETIENQKKEVEHQKDLVEEKNQEILDSITYAKRIQQAILPPDKLVKEYLANSFVLYKPKDIVAGDFYWMEPVGDSILFAAADCTGHGVPGAMVSVVCNNGLNRSVREYGLKEPGKILDKTREIVMQEFEKSEEEVKDGMDIAICSLKQNELKYAGAHNPLWIIRKGADEIEEIKANKQPIGKYTEPKPFDTHVVELNEGDTFYIFSDGFADQFGGDKGKKFKAANFKKLLVSIQEHTIDKQKNLIDKAFEEWRGSLEQLDDVCIIGVRV